MNIIQKSIHLQSMVAAFVQRARAYYYWAVLFSHRCPKCGHKVMMVRESQCRCEHCNHVFDPTVRFQRCSSCGGLPVLSKTRYHCRHCGDNINSRYVFDGIVFDAEYFKKRMAESRSRRNDVKQRIREMLAQSRSERLTDAPIDLTSLPGLQDALDGLSRNLPDTGGYFMQDPFDMKKYQKHVKACLGPEPMDIRAIPALSNDARKDLIWRFIAVIFMVQYGTIDIQQQEEAILVIDRDIDNQG